MVHLRQILLKHARTDWRRLCYGLCAFGLVFAAASLTTIPWSGLKKHLRLFFPWLSEEAEGGIE